MQWDKSLQTGPPISRELARCLCGAMLPGGKAGCVQLYNELLARDYTNALYAGVHMLVVDCHSLQHPEDHGIKNNAVHLLSLCWQLEVSGQPGRMPNWIRREFDGKPVVPKLEPPQHRSRITVADVHGANDPTEHVKRVHNWAAAVWDAWRIHQPWARKWLTEKSVTSGAMRRV
jgi:Family of unknown function (DUF5946)